MSNYYTRAADSASEIQRAKDVHSLIFSKSDGSDEVNTYLDWGLIPSKRPRIKKAPLKEHYIDLAGANGYIDVTELLSGEPTFGSREDSITFYIDYDRLKVAHPEWFNTQSNGVLLRYYVWDRVYDEVSEYLHGQYRKMILSDDPLWYYLGRWTIDDFLSEASYSQITVSYTLQPYKISVSNSNKQHI